jgi:hypothetical protein
MLCKGINIVAGISNGAANICERNSQEEMTIYYPLKKDVLQV